MRSGTRTQLILSGLRCEVSGALGRAFVGNVRAPDSAVEEEGDQVGYVTWPREPLHMQGAQAREEAFKIKHQPSPGQPRT